MALIFEQILTAELGVASYLVGDDSAGIGAVIDPQLDAHRYLHRARKHGLAIRHVLQTHTHEDFVSGATALAACTGAEVGVSGHDAPDYAFAHRRLHDGDQIELGETLLTVRHTPGHAPEHISLLHSRCDSPQLPFAVLSGGSLLVDSAGRTDLLGDTCVEKLTRAQFRTLREFYLALDDGVIVYPTHVHGSPCGAAIGDRMCTTVGHERRHNPLLQHAEEDSFCRAALHDLAQRPTYYPRLKEHNIRRQPASAALPAIQPLSAEQFKRALHAAQAQLVDTRHMLAFGGAHIAGALNIGANGHLGIWAGRMLDADQPLLIVVDNDGQLPAVLRQFSRTGFENFAGYLVGGLDAWASAGEPVTTLCQLPVQQLAADDAGAQLIDVRSLQEWHKGYMPGARHVFLPDLSAAIHTLDKGRTAAVYCDSGYRASIGASLLRAHGFSVCTVPGSWQAWTARGLPVQRPQAG
jgi:hydroxyacylglutathione hydrolase